MRGGEFNIQNLSEKEQGYISGLFEGDGYKIHDKNSRRFIVEFYLNSIRDKKIILFITSLLKKMNLNPGLYKDKRFNCMRVRVCSKPLFPIVNKNFSFKGRSKDFLIGFVSGFIDSEGYVNKEKYTLSISNTNKFIMDQCKQFLESIGIHASLAKRKPSILDKLPSYQMYISVNFKSVPHLSIKAAMLDKTNIAA